MNLLQCTALTYWSYKCDIKDCCITNGHHTAACLSAALSGAGYMCHVGSSVVQLLHSSSSAISHILLYHLSCVPVNNNVGFFSDEEKTLTQNIAIISTSSKVLQSCLVEFSTGVSIKQCSSDWHI
jgi:hypothetical protein